MAEQEKSAQDIWNEELGNEAPADLKLSEQAQGTSTNGNDLGDKHGTDHGAGALLEQQQEDKDKKAAPPPPAAAAPAPAAPPPAKEKTVDEKLEEMRQQMQADFDRRTQTLQSELQQLRSAQGNAAAAAATAAVPAAPTKEQIKEASKSTEKWDKMKAEFPEWTEAFDERMEAMKAELKPADAAQPDFTAERNRLTGEIAKARAEIRDELTTTMENRFVERVHRGWKQLTKTKEFVEWFHKQDAATQKLGASPIAEDAIDLLDKYKADKAAETSASELDTTSTDLRAQNRERLARASTAPAGQRGAQKGGANKSPDDMTAEEYWNHLIAVDEQKDRKQ